MFGEKILLFTVAVDMITTARDDLEKPVARHLVLSVSFILIWFRYKADSIHTHRSGGMKRKCDTSLMWWSEPRADGAAGWLFFCSWVSMVVPPFLFKLHFEEKNIYCGMTFFLLNMIVKNKVLVLIFFWIRCAPQSVDDFQSRWWHFITSMSHCCLPTPKSPRFSLPSQVHLQVLLLQNKLRT